MDRVVAWSALCALIEPVYPKAGNGWLPIVLERMLRIYFLQNWFNLSDPAVGGRLAQQDLIHRFDPGVVCPREYRDALRSGGRSQKAYASHTLRLPLCRQHKDGYRP